MDSSQNTEKEGPKESGQSWNPDYEEIKFITFRALNTWLLKNKMGLPIPELQSIVHDETVLPEERDKAAIALHVKGPTGWLFQLRADSNPRFPRKHPFPLEKLTEEDLLFYQAYTYFPPDHEKFEKYIHERNAKKSAAKKGIQIPFPNVAPSLPDNLMNRISLEVSWKSK